MQSVLTSSSYSYAQANVSYSVCSIFKVWSESSQKMYIWLSLATAEQTANSAVATELKKVSFHSNSKKGNAKECSNYCTIALISHASKVMHKILQARFQQNMKCDLPDGQEIFQKSRGIRDQITNICWNIKKAREIQKNIHFCFIEYAKAFDSMNHNKLWKILQEMGIPDHLTGLLRSLHAGQEATFGIGHGTTDWFQIGKGVHKGCILSPSLFNLYAECTMKNARLDEAQAGIKISGRNINNLRYTDDTTLMAEREELKSLLMKVKEESEKVDLKLNIQKTGIMASSPITSWQRWGNNGNSVRLYFLRLQNHCKW